MRERERKREHRLRFSATCEILLAVYFARNLGVIVQPDVAISASSFSLEGGVAFIAVDAGINFHRRAGINRARVIPPRY